MVSRNHDYHRNARVYYMAGEGWHYKLHGDVRGPFKDAEAAGVAMESEKYQLRAIRRAEAGEAMTFADKQRESVAMGYRP